MAMLQTAWLVGRGARGARRARYASGFAQSLTRKDGDLRDALCDGVAVHRARHPHAKRPPLCLPTLPPSIVGHLDTWAEESEALAEGAENGRRACAWSVPLLISSQLGRHEKVISLSGIMCSHLDKEALDHSISTSFHTWMLGRLLLASDQVGDSEAALKLEQELTARLDALAAERLKVSPNDLEKITDPFEAWAWGYLSLHYGGESAHDYHKWLKSTRMLWAATECAAGLAPTSSENGNRMWVNVLTLLALSCQHSSGTVLASSEPLAKASMTEMFEDAELFFRYKHNASLPLMEGCLDLDAVSTSQLTLSDALRQIPVSDFRTWAVGLTQMAMAQVQEGTDGDSGLEKRFLKAMSKSDHPGDKALGATSWMYARYVSLWWQMAK